MYFTSKLNFRKDTLNKTKKFVYTQPKSIGDSFVFNGDYFHF